MPSKTNTSATVTSTELQSILQSKDLNFYVTKIGAAWMAYIKNDCFAPQTTMQECYFTIEINKIH